LALLAFPVFATPKRDSSTPHPDPEIEEADLRGRIKRRDAPLRMTIPRGYVRKRKST
jgi:hypothetical protein